MAPNWFDVVIMGWFVLGAIKGLAGGFVRIAVRIAGFLIAVTLLYPYSQVWGGRLASVPTLVERASAWLRRSGALPPEVAQAPAGEAIDRARSLVASMHLPTYTMPTAGPGMTLEEYVVRLFLQFLLGGIIFLAMLAVVYLLADLLGSAVQAVLGRLPLFGAVNRLGGAVLGIGEHVVLAALVVGLAAPVLMQLPGGAGRFIRDAVTVEPLIALFRSFSRLAGI